MEELLILSPKPSTISILYLLQTKDSGTSEVALSPPFAKTSGLIASSDLQTVLSVSIDKKTSSTMSKAATIRTLSF